jgi:hypothetical protein
MIADLAFAVLATPAAATATATPAAPIGVASTIAFSASTFGVFAARVLTIGATFGCH